MELTVKGLSRIQANALAKAFELGIINQVVNELFMRDAFEAMGFKIPPYVKLPDNKNDKFEIIYLSEN